MHVGLSTDNYGAVFEWRQAVGLQEKLKVMPDLKKAFEALTPGRQRGYLLYLGSAKQSKTRVDRIDKLTSQILEGRGLDD